MLDDIKEALEQYYYDKTFHGIDIDLTGHSTGAQRPPGPLADPGAARSRSVDPRTSLPAPHP